MNFIASIAPPVVLVVNGQRHEFPRLKLRVVALLMARWAAEDRKRLQEACALGNLSSEQTADRMQRFEDESRLVSYFLQSLFRVDRACEAVLESMRIIDPRLTPEALDNLGLTVDELVDLACLLAQKAPVNEEGEASALPLASGPTGGGTGSPGERNSGTGMESTRQS